MHMFPITPALEHFLGLRDQEWAVKVEIDGVEYGNDSIIDFEIQNDIISSDEFQVGQVIVPRLTLTMRTRDKFPASAKIVPFVGAALSWMNAYYPWEESHWPWTTEVAEWFPLGEFYIDTRENVDDVQVLVCYGKLIWADVPYVSTLNYPATMQDVWDEICDQLGLTYEGIELRPYTIPVAPTGFTCRQIMGYIAGAHGASIYAGLDGVIRWKKYTANDTPVFEMTMSDYIRMLQTNPVKSYTRVVVYYEDYELEYEAGEGDENHTLYVENPFASQAMADALFQQLNGFAYVPIEMDARAFPHLEPGDIIVYETNESPRWIYANESWEEMDQSWEGTTYYRTIVLKQTLTFKGGMKMRIEAPSLSEQQSEIPIEGTLTRAIRRVNENALKKGRTYYGLSIDDEYGLNVKRSDGKSELTLNSDVMDWKVDGVSQLYYDALDNRLKFGGTLEGVDGIFSGTIEAGTFIGGTIIGTSISGGTIIGTNIASSTTYPRAELSVTQHLVAAKQDADNYLAMQSQGVGNTPALTFYANGSLLGFLNRSVNGLTIGTFEGDSLMFQSAGHLIMTLSGSLLIDGNTGLTGTFYVATTPGGPANTQVTFYKGIRIG